MRKILRLVKQHNQYFRDSYTLYPLEFGLFSFMLKNNFSSKFQVNNFDTEFGYNLYVQLIWLGYIFQIPNYEKYQNENLVIYNILWPVS